MFNEVIIQKWFVKIRFQTYLVKQRKNMYGILCIVTSKKILDVNMHPNNITHCEQIQYYHLNMKYGIFL